MKRLVLLRHGQSQWNLENRFTGWIDVPVTEQGAEEAKKAGKLMKEEGFQFKIAFTSYLKRAIKTLWIALEEMDMMWIPVKKSWRLNEKHYGNLQGLNKIETAEKYGDEQVLVWRRSFDIPPKELEKNDPRNPQLDPRYAEVPAFEIPLTESLKEVIDRFVPFWQIEILPTLKKEGEVLIAAHGNSLRALVMFLKNMSKEAILEFNIPTGVPYVFEFDDELNLLKDYFLGDPEEVKKLMEQVANQAKKK